MQSGQGRGDISEYVSCHQFITWKRNNLKKKKRYTVSSLKSSTGNPDVDFFWYILQYFRVMSTNEQAWLGEKCPSQTFTDSTSKWGWKGLIMVCISYSCFANHKTVSKSASLRHHLSVAACLCSSVLNASLGHFCFYPARVATNPTLADKLFAWFSESTIRSILFPISNHTSSILRSAVTIISHFFQAIIRNAMNCIHCADLNLWLSLRTHWKDLDTVPPFQALPNSRVRLQYNTLPQKQTCNNSFWLV